MPSMPSKKTQLKLGVKTAVFMYRHPRTRQATVIVLRPVAKVGWRVGMVVVKRKARQRVAMATAQGAARVDAARAAAGAGLDATSAQLGALGERSRFLGQMATVYGPPVAEVLGLVEPPKPRRTGLKVTAGVVIGAGAMYFLEPEHGPERRGQLQQLMTGSR